MTYSHQGKTAAVPGSRDDCSGHPEASSVLVILKSAHPLCPRGSWASDSAARGMLINKRKKSPFFSCWTGGQEPQHLCSLCFPFLSFLCISLITPEQYLVQTARVKRGCNFTGCGSSCFPLGTGLHCGEKMLLLRAVLYNTVSYAGLTIHVGQS